MSPTVHVSFVGLHGAFLAEVDEDDQYLRLRRIIANLINDGELHDTEPRTGPGGAPAFRLGTLKNEPPFNAITDPTGLAEALGEHLTKKLRETHPPRTTRGV